MNATFKQQKHSLKLRKLLQLENMYNQVCKMMLFTFTNDVNQISTFHLSI